MVTTDVAKVSVMKVQRKMYAVTLKLTVTDGVTELISQNFTENHKIGNTVAYTVARFLGAMQTAIDDYQAEQNIYNAPALNSALTTLKEGLVWG